LEEEDVDGPAGRPGVERPEGAGAGRRRRPTRSPS